MRPQQLQNTIKPYKFGITAPHNPLHYSDIGFGSDIVRYLLFYGLYLDFGSPLYKTSTLIAYF